MPRSYKGKAAQRKPKPNQFSLDLPGADAQTVRRKGGPGLTTQFTRDAVRALPEEFFANLAEDRPDLDLTPGQVRVWLLWTVALMRAHKNHYTDLRRTATSWWARAHRRDVRLALQREELTQAKAIQREAHKQQGGIADLPAWEPPADFFTTATLGSNETEEPK